MVQSIAVMAIYCGGFLPSSPCSAVNPLLLCILQNQSARIGVRPFMVLLLIRYWYITCAIQSGDSLPSRWDMIYAPGTLSKWHCAAYKAWFCAGVFYCEGFLLSRSSLWWHL